MNAPVFFESAGDERGTPQAFFDELNAEFHFDLDAAASPENHKCELYMGKGGIEEDALAADWGGSGVTVFLNPPYSIAGRFIAKAREEAEKGAKVVNLLPVRSDTKWWHTHIWDKDCPSWAQVQRIIAKGKELGIEYTPIYGDVATAFLWEHFGERPHGDWRPGVRGRFLPGRLGFELVVPPSLREWIKSERQTLEADMTATIANRKQAVDDWLKSMSSVTGLPKMAVERILQDKPDSELLEGAPFPSCVVIFSKAPGGIS